jgi:addiction module HigA family antidote
MSGMTDDPIMPPLHPGEILRREFLEPLGMTDEQLADAIGVPPAEISAITGRQRGVSAYIGVRLSRYFGLSEGFWTGLQEHYERELASDRARGIVRYENDPGSS